MTIQPSEFRKGLCGGCQQRMFVELTARSESSLDNRPYSCIFLYGHSVAVAARLVPSLCWFCYAPSVFCAIPSHISLRKQQRWVRLGLIIGCISIVFIMSEPVIDFLNGIGPLQHVAVRIENALNPFTDPHNNGYQLINGLYGFARSGFTGVGLGNSIQKYGYLTQSDNDFILSIIVEELGIFGLMVVVLGYVVILQRLFYYAFHTKSEGYKVILVGTAMYIFIHFALNVGGVSGLIPLTGVPLLFISSGGSSLISPYHRCFQSVISRIRRQGSVAVSAAAKRICTIKKTLRGKGLFKKGKRRNKDWGVTAVLPAAHYTSPMHLLYTSGVEKNENCCR